MINCGKEKTRIKKEKLIHMVKELEAWWDALCYLGTIKICRFKCLHYSIMFQVDFPLFSKKTFSFFNSSEPLNQRIVSLNFSM